MKELNINILFGTEIFLKYHSLFTQILDNGTFDKINCSLSKEAVVSLRGEYGNSFYESYYGLMRFILNDDRINIVDNQTFETMDTFDVSRRYGVEIEYKIRHDLIKEFDIDLPEKYITISTKSLNSITQDTWYQIRHIFINILNTYKYPIILLGERYVMPCKEYEIHRAYCIYEDLINGLNDYIDLTIEDSTHNNDLEPLQKTFYIINKSKLNLYISNAGIRTITISCSENVLGVLSNIYDRSSFKHKNIDNIYQTQDIQDYMNRLYNFIIKNND